MTDGSLWVIMPILCLVVGASVVYLLARLLKLSNQSLAFCTSGAFVAALASLVRLSSLPELPAAAGDAVTERTLAVGGVLVRADPGAIFVSAIALGLGLCVAIYSGRYISLDRRYHTYYSLLLLLTTGIIGMVLVKDLFVLYLFCELMSVTAYVLVAFRRHTDTAIEAGFKYLIMSTVGTLVMLLGIAWIYRETGTVVLSGTATGTFWLRAGAVCFLVGLGLKSGIVPLHTWLPDAYGRSPSSVSAFLAGIGSKSTLYLILPVGLGLGVSAFDLGTVLIGLSFLNMTVGNVVALVQTNTKRLLAYSSVAQAGYILFAFGVGLRYQQPEALQAGLFLLLAHAVMKALAFLSKGVCHFYMGTTLVHELRGTFQQLPLIAVSFSVALLGLAGFPPLAGFAAKWLILSEALATLDWLGYVGVAVFLINTLVSLAYYLSLIVEMFSPVPPGKDAQVVETSPWMTIPIIGLGLLVVVLGILPGPWLRWIGEVARVWLG